MLKNLILFAANAEHRPALAALLREHNPGLTVSDDLELCDLEQLEPEELQESRLICFGGPLTLQSDVVKQIGHGAYQFYYAPLQYPGLAPTTAQEAEDDGPCVSVIAQSIGDAAPFDQILDIETVTLPPNIEAPQRDLIAFTRLARMFWRLSHAIACESMPAEPRSTRLN